MSFELKAENMKVCAEGSKEPILDSKVQEGDTSNVNVFVQFDELWNSKCFFDHERSPQVVEN